MPEVIDKDFLVRCSGNDICFLRIGGESYGPVPFDTVKVWACTGRLLATNEISTDGCRWSPVENVPQLEMHWVAKREDGTRIGAFNLNAVPNLIAKGLISTGDTLVHLLTSETKFVSEHLLSMPQPQDSPPRKRDEQPSRISPEVSPEMPPVPWHTMSSQAASAAESRPIPSRDEATSGLISEGSDAIAKIKVELRARFAECQSMTDRFEALRHTMEQATRILKAETLRRQNAEVQARTGNIYKQRLEHLRSERGRSLLRTVRRSHELEIQLLNSTATLRLYRREVAAARQALAESLKDNAERAKRITELQTLLDRKAHELSEHIEYSERGAQKAAKDMSSVQSELDELVMQLAETRSSLEERTATSVLERETLAAERQRNDALVENLAESTRKLDALTEALRLARTENEAIAKQLAEIQAAVQAKTEDAHQARNDLEREASERAVVQAQLQERTSELDNALKSVAALHSQAEAARRVIEEQVQALARSTAEASQCESLRSENATLLSRISNLEAQIRSRDAELAEAQQKARQIETASERITHFDTRSDSEKHEGRQALADMTERSVKLEAQLQKTMTDLETARLQLTEFQSIREHCAKLDIDLANTQAQLQKAEKSLNIAQEEASIVLRAAAREQHFGVAPEAAELRKAIKSLEAEYSEYRSLARQRQEELWDHIRGLEYNTEFSTDLMRAAQNEITRLQKAIGSEGERQDADKWFLMHDENTVYGPVDLGILQSWVSQCRVSPDHRVSRNQRDWYPVTDIPELKMHWMIELTDGSAYGPISLLAVSHLLKDGVVRKDCDISNPMTHMRVSAGNLLVPGFDFALAEIDRLTIALCTMDRVLTKCRSEHHQSVEELSVLRRKLALSQPLAVHSGVEGKGGSPRDRGTEVDDIQAPPVAAHDNGIASVQPPHGTTAPYHPQRLDPW